MRYVFRQAIAVTLLAVFTVLVVPAGAQEELGPGEGGPIIWPTFGGDVATVNPLITSTGDENDLARWLFPYFVRINPETGLYEPGILSSLATDWEVSDGGQTYTFTLRDDWAWSDGTPITSADVLYAYEALASGELSSPRESSFPNVVSVEAPDAQTIVVSFDSPVCNAVNQVAVFTPVPAHYLNEQLGEGTFAGMDELDFNLEPDVTANAFTWGVRRPGEQTALEADQNYPDSPVGSVIPVGVVYRQLENQTVIVDQFLDGGLTLVDSVPDEREAELRAMAEAGELQFRSGLSSGWQFMAFNLADPENPQNGLDEEGNPIPQGNHPIFGDVRVRQAVHLAMDFEALNEGAFAGGGVPQPGPLIQSSPFFNEDLEPYPYDEARAIELLEEAGWIDHDDDPETPRIADGALYAEDGTELSFAITSFGGNPSIDNTIAIMQDFLGRVGFEVETDILEFQTMIEILDAQTFDTIMLFFGGFDPTDPDGLRDLFTPQADDIPGGFNSSSYSNERVTEIFDLANVIEGCDFEERKALYDEMQAIIHEEVPFFFISTSEVLSVVQPDVANFDPQEFGGGLSWNMMAWSYELAP